MLTSSNKQHTSAQFIFKSFFINYHPFIRVECFFFKSHHHIIRHRCFVFKIVVQSAWNMFHFIYSTLSWQHINRIQISSKQLRCSNLLSSIVHCVLYVLCNTCTLSWVLFIFVWSHQNGHVKDGRVHRSNNCHRVIGFVFRFFFLLSNLNVNRFHLQNTLDYSDRTMIFFVVERNNLKISRRFFLSEENENTTASHGFAAFFKKQHTDSIQSFGVFCFLFFSFRFLWHSRLHFPMSSIHYIHIVQLKNLEIDMRTNSKRNITWFYGFENA